MAEVGPVGAAMSRVRRRSGPRSAFVLSGGGNLGALQVGMLAALAAEGIVADVVLGCSVGAMNGAVYAMAPTPAGVARLEAHWCSVDSPRLMPTSRIPSALQLVRRGASLHRNDGLRSSLEEVLGDRRSFEDLQLPFQCVATEVETAHEHWFTEGDLVEAIMASAALPAVFPPVTVEGRRYVDGGVVDNVPVARAVELGCTEIYVLHVGPHGRPDADVRRPIDGALLAYWLARNSRFARDLAALPAGVEAVVLPPGQRPELKYDDFSQSAALIDQGRRNTEVFLAERREEIEQRRSDRSLRTRLRRLRLPSRGTQVERAREAVDDPGGAIVTTAEPDAGSEDLAAPANDAGAGVGDSPEAASGTERPAAPGAGPGDAAPEAEATAEDP